MFIRLQYLLRMTNKQSLLSLFLLLICLSFANAQYINPLVTDKIGLSSSTTPKKFPLEEQLKKFSDMIISGDLQTLNTKISDVLTNRLIECPQMSTYINKATEIMKKKISNNENQLKSLQNIPKNEGEELKKYEELKIMLTNLKNSLQKKNLNDDIKLRENQKKQFNQSFNQYTELINSYLSSLRDFKKKNNIVSNTGKEQTAILKLENQLKDLENQIDQTSRKRSSLHKNMTAIKSALLAQQISARESVSQQNLQAEYRKYSQLALKVSQKSKDKQQELNRLKASLQTKQQTPTAIDVEIEKATKQLEQKKSANVQKNIAVIKYANDVLRTNLKNLEDKIIVIQSGCFVSS